MRECTDMNKCSQCGKDAETVKVGQLVCWECFGDDVGPACSACGIPFDEHLGLVGTCGELQQMKMHAAAVNKELEKARKDANDLYWEKQKLEQKLDALRAYIHDMNIKGKTISASKTLLFIMEGDEDGISTDN